MKHLVESIRVDEAKKLKYTDFNYEVYNVLSELAQRYEDSSDKIPNESDWDQALEWFKKKFFEV